MKAFTNALSVLAVVLLGFLLNPWALDGFLSTKFEGYTPNFWYINYTIKPRIHLENPEIFPVTLEPTEEGVWIDCRSNLDVYIVGSLVVSKCSQTETVSVETVFEYFSPGHLFDLAEYFIRDITGNEELPPSMEGVKA